MPSSSRRLSRRAIRSGSGPEPRREQEIRRPSLGATRIQRGEQCGRAVEPGRVGTRSSRRRRPSRPGGSSRSAATAPPAARSEHKLRLVAKVERMGEMSRELLHEFFRDMLLIRRFEEKVEERFRAGELPGFLHVAIGQEATAVGVCRALEDGDVIASTHRAHGHALAKGTSPNAVMAELYGKAEGCSRGYGGSMHLYDIEHGLLGRQRGDRRRAAGDRRLGACLPAPRRGACRARVLRRRRDEHRHVPRGAQPRAALAGARGVRVREQPLGRVHAGHAAHANRGPVPACGRIRDGDDQRRRPGRGGGVCEGARSSRARALRKRPGLPALRDEAVLRPLHRRSAGVPRQGRGVGPRENHDPLDRARERLELSDEELEELDARDPRVVEGRSSSRRTAPTRPRRTLCGTSTPDAEISYREAVRDALSQAMRQDQDVFIMGEDIAEMGGSMGVTQGMLAEFGPERVRNTPISEMRSSARASARPCRGCGPSSR